VLILIVAQQLVSGRPMWTAVFLPLVILPLALVALGVSWVLASLGVFLRDIGHTVALAMQILFFMTPIFYPREALPARFRILVDLNPLASMVDNLRRITVLGLSPDWRGFGFSIVVALITVCFGHAWFVKTKRAFADVI
jgi:lipopolysaccharide transport system permease protein